MKKVILFDVGNTNTKIALADESGMGNSYTLPTRPANTADDWGLKMDSILAREKVTPTDVDFVAVSSVVPPMDPLIAHMAKRFYNCEARFAPRQLPIPLENHYARPEQVGADILVGAWAARLRAKERSLVVVDFGTATTLACIQDQAFLGGLICPGVLSSMRSLHEGTAKLPAVDLSTPGDELHWGTSTSECLNQGLVFGFADMVNGLCERLIRQLGDDVRVIATGGLAANVCRLCPAVNEVVPDLLMEGLWRAAFPETAR